MASRLGSRTERRLLFHALMRGQSGDVHDGHLDGWALERDHGHGQLLELDSFGKVRVRRENIIWLSGQLLVDLKSLEVWVF